MALFDFLATLDATHFLLLIIIFVLFVVSMKKALSIIINVVWAAGISLLFPVVMNKLFDFQIPMDPDTLVSFMILGVGAYFIYLVASSIYKILGIAGKIFGKVPKPKVALPKGDGAPKADKKEMKLREREMKLKEKELRLKEKDARKQEEQAQWMSTLGQTKQKPVGKKTKKEEYVELKDEEPKKKNFAEPMAEIKPKKRKKGDDDE